MTLSSALTASSVSSTVTIAAANSGTLAYPITLACSGTLPSGTSCMLSNTVFNSPTTSSTVTVTYNPQLAANAIPAKPGSRNVEWISLAALLGGLFLLPKRRRLQVSCVVLMGFTASVVVLSGCGGSKPSSSLTLAASTTTATPGSAITFNAQFAGYGSSATPNGTISLNDSILGSNRSLGTVAVSSQGVASLTVPSLRVGMHSISAQYTGDAKYPAVTSSPVNVQVSATAALQIIATDANGQRAAATLGVTLQ